MAFDDQMMFLFPGISALSVDPPSLR